MGNTIEVFLETKNRTATGQAVSLLGTYPDKTRLQKDTRTPMFTAAPFTTAQPWKQPKCHQLMNG